MKATLTTLTPVHIGNGTTYNKNIDFIQSGNKIGYLDEKKIFGLIGEENLPKWVSAIERGGNAIIDLLKSRGWNEVDLSAVCHRVDMLRTADHHSTQLKECYRTPLKGLCIPGSSLKGAIRTAVFNSLLDEEELKKIGIDQMTNFKGKLDFNKLDKQYFGPNANEKSTRFLKVRDVHFENVQANVYEVQILDAFHEGWFFKQGQQALVEAIPANLSAEFDLVIDKQLLELNIKKYPAKWPDSKIIYLQEGIQALCDLVSEQTKYLIGSDFNDLNEEKLIEATQILDAYDTIYGLCENRKENEMILRVGGHSGYIFTTGKWVSYIDLDEEQMKNLRKTIQKRDYSDMLLWPKSRKVTPDGQLFGFVKITFS